MASKLGQLTIGIAADLASLKKDMREARRTVETNMEKISAASRKTGRIIGGLAGAFIAGGGLSKIISATRAQEAAVKQLEAGLASTGGVVGQSIDELKKKAAELQKVTTFGDEEIIQAQAQLVTFTQITGQEFDKTIELAADLSTRFGTDLKSSIVQLGKALNDPVANLSALSRSGIQFDESQKAIIKTLVKSGRLLDAQKIILKELETQFGGSARAARDAFGGALEGLGNAFDDLFEAQDDLDKTKESIEDLTRALQDPATIQAINDTTSAIILGTTKMIEWALKGGSLISGLGKKARLAFSDVFDPENTSDVAELNKQIELLERRLSLPGGAKEGIAKQLEELRKQRDFFKRGEDFSKNDPRSPTFKKPIEPIKGDLIDPASIEAAEAAKKLADKIAKEQERQVKAIQSAIKSAQPALKTFLDSQATAQSLLQAGKISQADYNNVMTVYQERLDKATGANDQWNKDLADAASFAESAKTEIEKLNEELARAEELAGKGLINDETLGRTKERVAEDIEAINEAAKEINKVGEAIAQGMQDVVADGFVSIWKGGFDEVLDNFGELLINLAAEAAAADFLNAIGFGGKDNKGGNLSNLFGSLFSFEGGGFTGSGSRTGGLDGRGGFLSMVHPNETVIDHTKGQSVGGTTNISINYSGTGDRDTDNRAAGHMARQINGRLDAGRRYS